MSPEEMQAALSARQDCQMYRRERVQHRLSGAKVRLHVADSQALELDDFSANDYLGLFDAPAPRHALTVAAMTDGIGSTGSPLLSGFTPAHADLSAALCDWLGCDDVLLFSSGFAANQAMLSALIGPEDVLVLDKLSHASMQDGLLSGDCRFRRYGHQQLHRLTAILQQTARAVVATEGVFSMDGDITDLPTLLQITGQRPLLLDDAHGLGVLGSQGQGSWSAQGVSLQHLQCLMGNFGKALGASGGFLAGSRTVIDFIRQQARHYIYSTALSPALCRAISVSIRLCRTEQWRRDKLTDNIGLFRQLATAAQLPLLPSPTAIQPVLCRDNAHVLACADGLRARGILAAAVRPPTVPQARLRLSLSAAHQPEQIQRLVQALAEVFEDNSC